MTTDTRSERDERLTSAQAVDVSAEDRKWIRAFANETLREERGDDETSEDQR